jgi:hypothetical protein
LDRLYQARTGATGCVTGSTVGVAQYTWIDCIEPEQAPPGYRRHNHTGLL